ncbi:chromatin assembly factor 1 subunit B-like [Dysidea avara]|uniref:chromatin assembly factor 1 subunit B-like n=1 Tax=Dysidea avara TaxID=196820 RepID=UPI00332456A5
MKVFTPEVVWHEKQPILSVDFHSSGRLASGGADNFVRIWRIKEQDNGKLFPLFMSELSRHTSSVNVVRFSPDGSVLASAGDDCVICLWKLSNEGASRNAFTCSGSGAVNQETWTITKILRGHQQDIYDLCWSHDSTKLISASVNHTGVVWDIAQAIQLAVLSEHQLYVQGVAWDPIGCYLATLSSDKMMRVYTATNYQLHSTVNRITHSTGDSCARISFHDETISTFFRRLSFSPDGSVLIVPTGKVDGISKMPLNATYIFTRNNFSKPVAYLPAGDMPTVVVRFSPVLYQLLPANDGVENSAKFIDLPYRMVYAVASQDSIVLYDTQSTCPFGYISNIHYASITDLTWSSDGHKLVASSSDGYCTILGFDDGEIGMPLASHEIPVGTRKTATVNMETSPPAKPIPVSTIIDQTTPQRKIIPPSTTTPVSGSSSDKKGPRRVQLITLSTTPAAGAASNSTNVTTNSSSVIVNSSSTPDTSSTYTTPVTAPDIVIL